MRCPDLPATAAAIAGPVAARLRATVDRSRTSSELVRAVLEGDDEPLRALVTLLERDHYLRRDHRGRHGFRFSLLQRWWRLQTSEA